MLPASAGPAIELFALVRGQWRHLTQLAPAGLGFIPVSRPVALDYVAVEAAARMDGLTVTPEQFGDLRALEAGALSGFADAAGDRS